MSVRPILPWPHPLLKEKSHRIEHFNDHLKNLCTDLEDTAKAISGPMISMSAVQIGSPTRVFYLGSGLTGGDPIFCINPVMIGHGETLQVIAEKCLSLPDMEIHMQRYASVRVEARNIRGDTFVIPAYGMLAQALQHELNHLNGKCIADCCNKVKRNFLADRQKMKFGGHRGRLLDYTGSAVPVGK